MKKLFYLIFTGLLLATTSSAQVDTSKFKLSNHELAERLMLKSKGQQTAGWVFLGGGAVLTAISFAVQSKGSGDLSTGLEDAVTAGIMFVAGAGLMIGSIPFFIVSGVNKRKARLLLTTDKVQITPQFRTNEWQLKTGIAIRF